MHCGLLSLFYHKPLLNQNASKKTLHIINDLTLYVSYLSCTVRMVTFMIRLSACLNTIFDILLQNIDKTQTGRRQFV